ncbi:MAG TPA: S8 family serine peptidase, partial [Candidatus Baltobacteraceae bacterium]
QLPGAGETITNVSLGDLDDVSAASNPNDPCAGDVQGVGPTTVVMGGQRYIDWPSMPLIPTYTADANSNLNGLGEVCGVDPILEEVGLDFAMMSPLPHNQQRMSNPGVGRSDLLGIAPGATYRLIVPASSNPSVADIDAALLAASQQTPRPNIITASLGFGIDQFGFPARYLEDDPLTESIVASIVQQGIVVCISSNDGLREYTNTAVSPSGGSAATNVVASGGTPTDLNDITNSTTPSLDFDSGAIAVGATTLDDIFAAQPQNTLYAPLASQHAFAVTRWTGQREFSSGFGSRVNLSAPGDNVVGFIHSGTTAQSILVDLSGGTSASAPEIAAAVAVVQQVARLTGHPFASPAALRSFLASTGTPVPPVPQSDVANNVGPQVDVGRAVAKLLSNANIKIAPSVARVAVEQRRDADFGLGWLSNLDGTFSSDTDPTNIDLAGPVVSPADSTLTAADRLAWITIAPDWEGLPAGTTFKFTATGSSAVIATTPWVRMVPFDLFADAGKPLLSSSTRTLNFTYSAISGGKTIASTAIPLTFGPLAADPLEMLAPSVPAVETGLSIPVFYDLGHLANVSNPTLIVSQPGRVDPVSGLVFDPSYKLPLSSTKATVNIPVSKLHGGGVYGIGIQFGTYKGTPLYSDFAFVRVAPAATSRPAAPLLAASGSKPGHFVEFPYGTPFQVSYDVSIISKATGAILEISAPGPSFDSTFESVNNPNGSVRDADGVDSGSVYFAPLSGTKGTATIDPLVAKLTPGFFHNVRVLPVSGSTAVGEFSDLSSVFEDGVAATDGGTISGFGINHNGTDAFLTSSASPDTTSLEIFDQVKKRITKTIVPPAGMAYHDAWDMFGSDTSFLMQSDQNGNSAELIVNPTATGNIEPQPVTTPANTVFAASAENQSSATGVFGLVGIGGNTAYDLFVLNLLSGATNVVDATSVAQGYTVIAQDPTTNTAYVSGGIGDCSSPSVPSISSVNLSTGATATTLLPSLGIGYAKNLAIDPAIGVITLLPSCESALGLYNLKTKTAIKVTLPVGYGTNVNWLADPQVDSINHLVLVLNLVPPDVLTNNNANINVVAIDEK